MGFFSKPKWAKGPKKTAGKALVNWRLEARRKILLIRAAKVVRAVNALQKRFRAKSFMNRGASFMRSKYFQLYHRKWGMRP